MSQRSSQKSSSQRSRNNDNVERRKSARLATNRIIDEITIGTTSADSNLSGADNESEIELVYEAPSSQKKVVKTPAKKRATPRKPSSTIPTEPVPSTSRAMTAGEMVVRQQMLEQEPTTPSPTPSSNRSTQQSRASIRRTPAKKKSPRLPPDWVKDRINQRNLRLEEICGVVDAEEEIQFIVKWKKLPQPERIGFADLRSVFPRETLRFLLSKMIVKTKPEFQRFLTLVEQNA